MINKSQQIKNSLIYILPKFLIGFLPVITLPIFTRVLTTDDYGVYALASIYAILLSGIVNFGLATGYERNFFQYNDHKKSAQLLYSTLIFVLINFLAALLITYIFKQPLARIFTGSAKHASLLFWVFFATVIMSFKQYYLIYFKNTENAKDFVIYSLDETLISTGLSLFFVAYLHVGIIGLAWGQCIASAVVLSALLIRFVKVLPLSFSGDVLRDLLKISIPLTPRIFMGVISTQLNKYVLSVLNAVGGVGIFTIAQNIANVSFTFMTTIQNVFNPQVYKKMFSEKTDSGADIGRYLTPFMYISIFICLGIALFSMEIVRLLTGPSFHSAAPLVTILAMYYGLLFFGKINGTQLIYKKKTFLTSLITILDIVVGVMLSIPFIKTFGIIGAAMATLLGGSITGTITFIIAQRCFNIRWEAGKIFAIFTIFCGSSLLTLVMMTGHWAYLVMLVFRVVCLIIYLFLGVKLQIIGRQNISLAWGAILNLIGIKAGKAYG